MWISANNKYGVAIHNWHGDTRHGLELDVGDSVEILEEYGEWLRGTCPRKPRVVGIFPRSYIYIKDSDKNDPVVQECTQVLREWSEIWKKYYLERDTYKFTYLRKVMLSLLDSRRELLGTTLTQDQTLEMQLKLISKIDWGNRKLLLDLVPRNGPLPVDPNKHSIVSLYHIHVTSAENAKACSSRGTLKRKAQKRTFTYHVYFCMRDFGHRIGDDAEIFFFLYDGNAARMRPLSERFLVRISKDGFSNYMEKLHSNCTVFIDLGESEILADLYLVANVIRVGKILHSESTKKGDKTAGSHCYRRPYGIGVLPLTDALIDKSGGDPEEKEFSFKIFQCEEKDYHQLHELIIKKASGKFSPISSTNSQGSYQKMPLVVSLKLIHGGLSQARSEQPMLFQGSTITKKIGFPDIIMPGDVRNDIFFTLERGEFERGGKSTAKNIEVTVAVYDPAGNHLTDCLHGVSSSVYKSMILYHNNSPQWNEMLRVSLSIDKFATAHMRFEFKHCSTRDKSEPKLFAFSFARLMEPNGATIADGSHELIVYKCEDPSKLIATNYLKLRCSATDYQSTLDSSPLYHRSPKEVFTVKSFLCSTKLTQNADLLSLLQWRTHPERIQDSLTRVMKLKDEELVKFFQDVLDALFSIFSNEEGNSTENSGSVFHVLVSIFSLLQSNKFQHFKPVMEAYIEDHFAAALVYKGLMTSVQHLAEWLPTAERLEPVQKCFASLEYIFKLIIQSRKLFARATGGQYEDSFKQDLYSMFGVLSAMLTIPANEDIIPTQEAVLMNASVVLEQLLDTLPASELGALARNILDSVPRESPGRIVQAKLQAIKHFVSGKLFHIDDCRSILLTNVCKHLRLHLARRDELMICADILSEILTHLFDLRMRQMDKPSNILQHDLNALCCNTLDILMETIIVIVDGSPNIPPSLVSALLGMLQQLDESHYMNLWEKLSANGNSKDLKDFLHKSLIVFKELMAQDWQVFPSNWLVMKLTANDVVRKAMEEFSKPLVYRFLSDSQLWWSYFTLAVTFLTQSCLQLEQYHEAKRRKILHSNGDMRVMMGFQILSMWSQLGDYKLNFIPSMVAPFLEVTLVPEPALRKATLTVFYDMMQCEQVSRGSFRLVESELIDKLDLLISENKGDDEYRELFSTMLLERVQQDDPVWRESGAAFISSVTKLLERLLDYRSVMQGDENRDKRMSCTVNLLNFYKNEINRKEMYLRYIYKLHDLHLQAENYTEAGFTLKLYADMLNWDRETTTYAPNDATGQPEWQRKEKLYKEILKYFDKGKCWEKGIPLCKELADFYETRRFDYNRLSDTLILEAKFFQNILTQIRPEPEYFRVGFYGVGFPLFVRNKQFIYRGLEYERIGAFTQRLQTEFPQAQILTKNSPPDPTILAENGQFIQISNVRPIANNPHFRTSTVAIPEKIARFYEVNDVTRFQHDRPIHKGQIDKENEFKSLWIERTTVDIASPLPGILRWFEIINKNVIELTPVEFACETMENVEKDLCVLIAQYKSDPAKNINPFSMRLQGVIDANVMGGISKYQEAFFTPQFASSNEGKFQHANVLRLKSLILKQMSILETALELHGQLAPVGVQPLQKRLLERFSQLKQSLSGMNKLKRQKSESIVNTPLPPLPQHQHIEKRATSLNCQNNFYEHDDIYTHPSDNSSLKLVNVDSMMNYNEIQTTPPIPCRPKSTGYIATNNTTPGIPPKQLKDRSAPPLPPRGMVPNDRQNNGVDKRSSNAALKYAIVNIPLDVDAAEQSFDQCDNRGDFFDNGNNDSNDLDNPTNRSLTDSSSVPESLNIQSMDEDGCRNAPPIPPKPIGNNISVASEENDVDE
ncbi:dedicator of cytokinesis protein 3 isoform X2 [Bradysia coprophila]|uniref:dedicator of cytokinesis protein 3 isoform X2 n=1 Tax=Bradysia coprophila TaxID=38358 RepID=UPI00187D99DE|nr:dedicator of cytokinesis protein 3 isoform X2 [Bradysia coprophila]